MTEHHTNKSPAELTKSEARGAKPVKGMTLVLGISLAAVVLGGIIFMLFFATA